MSEDTYRMTLSRPIDVLGEQRSELVLGDPPSSAIGDVELTLGPKGLTFRMDAITKLIAAAAGIPLETARQISGRDVWAHAGPIMDFFDVDIHPTGGS